MPTIEVNGTTLYYERSGAGPAIVFVHGQCGDADVWAVQARRLSDRYTCFRYDRRGHSRSARGDGAISTALHADDAAALIERLELAPCLLVGSSFGAVIAVDVALRHARLLRGAVFSEPPLFSLDPEAGRALVSPLIPRLDEAIATGGARAGVDAFFSFVCPRLWSSIDDAARERYRANGEIGFADLRAPSLVVRPADLATVRVPALVIAGTASHPSFPTIARRLAGALPDARFVELEGSGHVTYAERPDDFAHALSVFAAEVGRRTHGVAAR